MSQDGTGFQFLWPDIYQLNDYAYLLSVYCMIIFLLLYTSTFLNLKTYYPTHLKWYYAFMIIRTLALVGNILFFPNIRHFLYIDVIPFFMAYYSSIKQYKASYPMAGYFVIGFSILLFGFLFNFFRMFGFFETNVYTFYFINVCFMGEMVIFYFALAQRIKYYKHGHATSVELQKILDDKSNQLDVFMYKTSHDIVGPVKSILGLANLGLIEKDMEPQKYFDMIQKTAKKLDEILRVISGIVLIKNQEVKSILIDPETLVNDVIELTDLNRFKECINVKVQYDEGVLLKTDYYIIHTLVMNILIFETQFFKESDVNKIDFQFKVSKKHCYFIMSAAGVFIEKEHHDNLFNIFFKLNNKESNTGTNLHVVKICVDKLGGTVAVRNENNTTYFDVMVPNLF